MLINPNIRNFFQYEKKELIATLIKAAIFVFRNHDKNTILLDEILQYSEIKIDTPIFLKLLEEELEVLENLEDKEIFYETQMHHSPMHLAENTISWQYYAIYFAFELKDKDIVVSKKDALLNKILNVSLNYHKHFLKYKKFENTKNTIEKDKQKPHFYKNISIGVVRAIEYLAKFHLSEDEYLYDTYLKCKNDLFKNLVDLSSHDIVESDCFFIVKDSKKGINFLKYENEKLGIHLQIMSTRKIGKGSDTNQEINRKIINYLSDAYKSYTKLITLKLKKEKTDKEGYHLTKNILQATEEEEYIEIQTKSNVTKSVEYGHEQNQRPTQKARVVLADKKNETIGNKFTQYKRNIAFSAAVTKNKLLLSTDYRIPEILHLKSFIQHLCSEKNVSFYDINVYSRGAFILSIVFGFSIDELILFLYSEHPSIKKLQKGKISVKIESSLFAKYHENSYLKKSARTINFMLQDYLYSLINKLSQYVNVHTNSSIYLKNLNWKTCNNKLNIRPLNNSIKIDKNKLENFTKFKDAFYTSMKKSIKEYDKSITIDLINIWKIPLRLHKILFNDDTIAMFSITKYQRNDTAKLSYTSTETFSQKFSLYIERVCNLLELNKNIKNLIDVEHKILTSSYTTVESAYSGSHRALKHDKGIIFFEKMYKLIFEEDDEKNKFNLISIYIRYAMSILCGTRDLKKSSTIQNISFKLHAQMITEKSDSNISGVRIIPLCKTIESLITFYKIECKNLKYISLYKNESFFIYNKKDALYLIKKITNDEWLHDFIRYVPINCGRHILNQYKVEKNFNAIYVETFLGHYISGGEQIGIYSPLNLPRYIHYIREHMENIAHLYGIKKL